MQKNRINFLVKSALIAGIYTVLTLCLGAISFGNLGFEFRISEALTILPVFSFCAVPGLFVGCFLSNLIGMAFSQLGLIDVVFGSFATLLAAVLSWALRNVKIKGFPFLSFLPPIVCNAVIIGFELKLILPDVFPSFWWSFISVGVGELVSVIALGIPLYFAINKIPFFKKYFID